MYIGNLFSNNRVNPVRDFRGIIPVPVTGFPGAPSVNALQPGVREVNLTARDRRVSNRPGARGWTFDSLSGNADFSTVPQRFGLE